MATRNKKIAQGGDTYHNRFAPDRKHNKSSKKYKPLEKKCSKCGTRKGQLDIHHKDGNRDNNNRSNLTYMCRSCHRSKHDGGEAYLISTAARIIDDPNNEASKQIASAHQNEDLMHVEFILCHEGTNGNKDGFTSDDLEANATTAINKPINWEHSVKNIGVIYESKFVSIASLSEEQKEYYGSIDPLEKDFVICRACVWEYKHPEEARVMRNRNDAGMLYFSMENKFGQAECSECNESFSSVLDYCDHLLTRRDPNSKASRVFKESNFVGAGVVARPADKGAKTLALANYDASLVHLYILSDRFDPIDYISYAFHEGGFEMREGIKVPKEYQYSNESLSSEFFADDVNKHFPIDSIESIEATANILLNKEHAKAIASYTKEEFIYLLERLAKAAQDYDLDLSSYVKGGNEIVTKSEIVESAEFKQALEEEKAKMESGAKMKELEDKITALASQAESLQSNLEEERQKAAEATDKLEAYKTSVEQTAAANKRMSDLAEAGFEFSDSTKGLVFSCASNLDDSNFESFVSLLTEVRETATAETKKNMEEEKKKKKDNKDGKDIVEASKEENAAVANLVDGDEEDTAFASQIDAVFTAIAKDTMPHLVKEVK